MNNTTSNEPSVDTMNEKSMSEDELSTAIESYIESFIMVEYGLDGLRSAKDAYADMELEAEGITFMGFILQSEEELAELVLSEFITHA
jgi:hypothetical protein